MQFILLAILALVVGACASQSETGSDFVAGTPISDELFEVSDFRCEERVSEMFIDDVLTEGRQFWGRGTITNSGAERSGNWLIGWDATLNDGTELASVSDGQVPGGTLVEPLDPGESSEFSFLVASDRTLTADQTVATCDFRVEDSVLNYGNN